MPTNLLPISIPIRSPILVIGTGRCGTGHVAAEWGLGHEATFSYGVRWGSASNKEASWMVDPSRLDEWKDRYPLGVIVHLIRDPADCIRSLAWGDGLWDGSPWSCWREERYPKKGSSRIEWAIDFYTRHWTFCQLRSNVVIRVEDVGVNTGVNSRPRNGSPVVLDGLPLKVYQDYYQ